MNTDDQLSTPDKNPRPGEKRSPFSSFAFVALSGALLSLIIGIFRISGNKPSNNKFSSTHSGSPQAMPPGPQPVNIQPGSTYAQPVASQPVRNATMTGGSSTATIYPTSKTRTSPSPEQSSVQPAQLERPQPWSRSAKYVVGIGLALFFLAVLMIGRSTLPLIILSALIAFFVRPFFGLLERRFKLSRGAAVSITYLLVVVILLLIPFLLVSALADMVNSLNALDLQAAATRLTATLDDALLQISGVPILSWLFSPILELLTQLLNDLATVGSLQTPTVEVTYISLTQELSQRLGILVNILGPLITSILAFVFMLLISLRFALSGEDIRRAYPKLLPPAYVPEVTAMVDRIDRIWSSFLRGQLTLMLIIGVLVYLLNLVLGTPQALLLGFISGTLELIPSLGPFLAAIPAFFLALSFGSTHFEMNHLAFALLVMLGYLAIQSLENQVFVPKILGDAVNLPPLVVLIGVIVAGSQFGILGIFLATPTISTGKEIIGYLYNKILEPPPAPPPPEEKPSRLANLRTSLGRLGQRARQVGRRKQAEEPTAEIPV